MDMTNALEELEKARAARLAGFEGRARVCARRAAVWAIQTKYAASKPLYGLDLLHQVAQDSRMPEHIRARASHLVMSVNTAHELPPGVDLITDAQTIIQFLSQAEEPSA
ncbi:hypothetical protein ADN00_08490 [Ornatilinea apprima]|uniref:Uncharacterized protein n=1 Tax=Ornatilinea apprima TaxID=1134406 RepID=A0A0P6XWU3_9CHLR|nr:hypothetical protein [Ornatilinea apprima]KPL77899.1 hypothetical protein ADN00_08490 [Ornatilinea apprima]